MELVTSEVTALAFGGQGIIRHEGLVIFVPFTAVGDQVTCRITSKKKSFAQGEIVEIKKPSLDRTNPPCPYYGTCGGCQLQHLKYDAQLEYKRVAIQDALKRIGHIPIGEIPPVIAAEQHWGYRRHITLHVKESNGAFLFGYFTLDNTSLLKIEQCPIFAPSNETIIQHLEEIIKKLHALPGNTGRATLFKQPEHKFLLHLTFEKLPSNSEEVLKSAIDKDKIWQGAVINDFQKALSFGDTRGHLNIEGLDIQFSPKSFIQNHPEQSLKIYKKTVELAKAVKATTILDLYCGIGISSLLLAKEGFIVNGVEGNPEAIAMAKLNCQNNNIANIRFQCSAVEKAIRSKLKEKKPDLIVVNPPRQGMDREIVEALIAEPVNDIIYISCMPPTLGRDLKLLCEKTYKVEYCQGYDMFPQTAHVETVVLLKKND